jgi:hypothetical protein
MVGRADEAPDESVVAQEEEADFDIDRITTPYRVRVVRSNICR